MSKTPRRKPQDAPAAEADASAAPAKPATRRRRKRGAASDATIRTFAIEAARLANDLHCEEVLLLDVRKISDVTDYILIATGTSDRQIRSVGQNLQKFADETGLAPLGRDVDDLTTWLVIDLAAVVIHLFDPATRGHYDLEMLWGDAPRLRWRRQ